jgi:hypothetical protein
MVTSKLSEQNDLRRAAKDEWLRALAEAAIDGVKAWRATMRYEQMYRSYASLAQDNIVSVRSHALCE